MKKTFIITLGIVFLSMIGIVRANIIDDIIDFFGDIFNPPIENQTLSDLEKPIQIGGKNYTSNDFYTELVENKADITGGYAIFKLKNPTNIDLPIGKTLLNFYLGYNNTPIKSTEIYVLTNVSHSDNITDFESICIPYNTTTIGNSTLDNTTYTVDNCTDIISGWHWSNYTTQDYIPLSNQVLKAGESARIKIIATWNARLGSVNIDWIPKLTLLKAMTKASDDISMVKPEWQWWNTSFSYKENITIDKSLILANLTNFPVMVNLTSSNFNFTNTLSNGFDIRFIASDETTVLAYERERHNSTSGNAEYWVNIPSISNLVNTTFYMYYGNPTANDGSNPTGVWDIYYKGVWHSIDNTTSSINDSTSNVNHGTKSGANQPLETTGQIYKYQNYTESTGIWTINTGSASSLDNIISQITMSAWVNWNSFTSYGGMMSMSADDTGPVWISLGGSNAVHFRIQTAVTAWGVESPTYLIAKNWYYVTGTYNNSATLLYYNKTLVGSDYTKSGNIKDHSATSLIFGNLRIGASYDLEASMDELRISNISRSASWVQADYYSVSNQLLTFGAEEKQVTPDTCTYSGSGDWNINCADNCAITTNTNLNANQIIFYGTGSAYLNANIVNISQRTFVPNCPVTIGTGKIFG